MPTITNIPNISYNFNLFVNVDDKLKFDNVKAADDKRRMIIMVLMFQFGVNCICVYVSLVCMYVRDRERVRDRKGESEG